MADRRGAANLAIPLMLGTLVLLAGFFYYLATTAEPTPPPVMEEEAPEETGPIATALNVDSVSINGVGLYGQMVRIENVNYGQALGANSFLVNSMQPFVVVMNEDMIAAGEEMPTGTFTLIGTLMERTDSILAVWLEDGTVTRSNEILADFASEYLIIDTVEMPDPMAGAGAADPSGM